MKYESETFQLSVFLLQLNEFSCRLNTTWNGRLIYQIALKVQRCFASQAFYLGNAAQIFEQVHVIIISVQFIFQVDGTSYRVRTLGRHQDCWSSSSKNTEHAPKTIINSVMLIFFHKPLIILKRRSSFHNKFARRTMTLLLSTFIYEAAG